MSRRIFSLSPPRVGDRGLDEWGGKELDFTTTALSESWGERKPGSRGLVQEEASTCLLEPNIFSSVSKRAPRYFETPPLKHTTNAREGKLRSSVRASESQSGRMAGIFSWIRQQLSPEAPSRRKRSNSNNAWLGNDGREADHPHHRDQDAATSTIPTIAPGNAEVRNVVISLGCKARQSCM